MPTEVLLSSPFRYPDRMLFFGRARLYPDRLELTGLTWTGRHRHKVPLADLTCVRWWADAQDDTNLMLTLNDGSTLSLKLKGAGLWKFTLQEAAGRRLDPPKPTDETLKSAAA